MKIVLLYDLPAAQRGDQIEDLGPDSINEHAPSALRMVQAALDTEHEVILIPQDTILEDRLFGVWPDLALYLTDDFGNPKDNLTLTTLLERWHIPYAGPSSRTRQLCQDRGATRRILHKRGLPTPVFTVAQTPDDLLGIDQFPVSIKPLFESTLDVGNEASLAYTRRHMRERVRWVIDTYDQPALVETYMPGRGFTVAILGNGSSAIALPLVERRYAMLPTGSLSAPGQRGQSKAEQRPTFDCPSAVAEDLEDRMVNLARQAFVTLGCLDFCSVHIRLDENQQLYIIEVDPLPGLLPYAGCSSAFLHAASAAEMTYPDLISRIVYLASQRHGLNV